MKTLSLKSDTQNSTMIQNFYL